MTSLLVRSKSFSFKHKNFQKQTTSFSAKDFPFHICLLLTTIRVTVVHPLPKPLQVTLNYIAQKTAIHKMKRTTSSVLHDLQTSLKHRLQLPNVIPRLQEAPHQLSCQVLTCIPKRIKCEPFSVVMTARGFLPGLGFPHISCVVIVYSLSSIFLFIDVIICYELYQTRRFRVHRSR